MEGEKGGAHVGRNEGGRKTVIEGRQPQGKGVTGGRGT